ncbi:uncharacterized protein LOC129235112 isoform X2 [Uloborus diversus]|uniref:uncharacterized protein LOC129235112 isoform X2 n=1 Tax=Uloborus diversus TaxID=327109 RepID=UPI00240A4F02|nr:uncharacterized protein LOC129235112 isoform X2 [Uloborus diversus]
MEYPKSQYKTVRFREDLLSPRKGKEPAVVKAVVHNPYNSPLSLYSTDNIAETLAKQTEVLTEGHISEEEEGPENLSFKQKSAVFQLLEEQAKQDSSQPQQYSRPSVQSVVSKPKAAPPPPPKPKPPSSEHLHNGYDSHPVQRQQNYQDQQKSTSRTEYQVSSQKVINQYQYQQDQPVQYQSSVHQSYQKSPGYQSPSLEKPQSPSFQSPNYQQKNYQNTYQQSTYQQSPGYHSPGVQYQQHPGYHSPGVQYQQHPGYQSPSTPTYQPLNQINYQQAQNIQNREQVHSPSHISGHQSQPQQKQQVSQQSYQNQKQQQAPSNISRAEFKIGPPPPPRGTSAKQDSGNMTAVYRQQYEQHLQQQYQQEQMYMNQLEQEERRKAHIVNGDIFEHNSTSGTPITYKAPPVAPPKPNWPPPPSQAEMWRGPAPSSPTGMRTVGSVWPPKKSTATDLPRTGFNPAAVREQGTGRRCVWPPPKSEDELRSGRNTPQSPVTGRRIQWNPSPSPPVTRRTISPARRKDINWPPPSPNSMSQDKENFFRPSPRLSRKANFDDYVKEHASVNVPQTYRPPPGTQHVEYR